MQLADWLRRIESLHPRAWDLGLERVAEVAERLDVVKPAPLIFLVAGTNGKGSVCTYIANLCAVLGLKTGLTTSPHLLRFNERIVVAGSQARDRELCEAFAAIEAARGEISLTYFEFAALAALWLFRRRQVDAAVLEVGLGGRLDAMNLVDPDVSVITRIALDHQDWLGHTRDAIAREKAGVMRPAVPCVLGDDDMPDDLWECAAEIDCRLRVPGCDFGYASGESFWIDVDGRRMVFDDLPAPLLPRPNAAAGIAAVFAAGLRPDRNQISAVLSDTTMAGRFQLIECERRTLLDVAHNPDAAGLLSSRLKGLDFQRCHAVTGMYMDKDIKGVLGALSAVVDCWYFSELAEPRGAHASELAACVSSESGCEIRTYDKVVPAYEDAVRRSTGGDLILVFGSFPAVADVLGFLQAPV